MGVPDQDASQGPSSPLNQLVEINTNSRWTSTHQLLTWARDIRVPLTHERSDAEKWYTYEVKSSLGVSHSSFLKRTKSQAGLWTGQPRDSTTVCIAFVDPVITRSSAAVPMTTGRVRIEYLRVSSIAGSDSRLIFHLRFSSSESWYRFGFSLVHTQ